MPIEMKRAIRESAATASSFSSYNVAIPDDDVATLTLTADFGHVMVAASSSSHHGMCWYRGSLVIKYFGGNKTDVGSTVLTGTTGTDGNMTISAVGNVMYIENRSGSELKIVVTFLGADRAYDVRFSTWSQHVDKTHKR